MQRVESTSEVTRWFEIQVEFSYRIEHRFGKKHINADELSRRPEGGCEQCRNIERRDGKPSRLDIKMQLGKAGVYS